MSLRRIYGAGFVLGLSVAAAVWLLTYRVWTVFQYIGLDGRHFHSSEHVKVTPWWSVPAAVAVMLAGAEISLWLLPGGRGLVRRLADHWVKVARRVQNSDTRTPAKSSAIDDAGSHVISGALV